MVPGLGLELGLGQVMGSDGVVRSWVCVCALAKTVARRNLKGSLVSRSSSVVN